MRTFAARQADLSTRRYTEDELANETGETVESARRILVSAGGRKAARHAIRDLHRASVQFRDGWLPTAQIGAPLRVLQSLVMTGVIEKADSAAFPETEAQLAENDGRTHAWRYRLTDTGRAMARAKIAQEE